MSVWLLLALALCLTSSGKHLLFKEKSPGVSWNLVEGLVPGSQVFAGAPSPSPLPPPGPSLIGAGSRKDPGWFPWKKMDIMQSSDSIGINIRTILTLIPPCESLPLLPHWIQNDWAAPSVSSCNRTLFVVHDILDLEQQQDLLFVIFCSWYSISRLVSGNMETYLAAPFPLPGTPGMNWTAWIGAYQISYTRLMHLFICFQRLLW